MQRRPAALSFLAASAVAVLLVGGAHGEDESPEDLPAGKGREETFYSCTACHGTALVKQQGMTRERWDSTLAFMVERYGMPEMDAADRDLVLDYLAAAFPPRRRGPVNPFLR